MAKNVLWVTALFTPINCGVGRQVKIAKYLPLYGWNPIVLTLRSSIFRKQIDNSMLKDTEHLEIHRTGTFESRLIQETLPALLKLSPMCLYLPDPWIGWLPLAASAGQRIIKKRKVDAIFSSAQPFTSHLVALALKKGFGLPWVADFRDLWLDNDRLVYPKPVRALVKRMEKAVISNADRVTIISESGRQCFIDRHPEEDTEKFISVGHGYDPVDFAEPPNLHPEFTVSYTGTVYAQSHDSVRMLLDAVDGVSTMKIRFMGYLSEQLAGEVTSRGHTYLGRIPHADAINELMRSHVALLLLGDKIHDSKGTSGKMAEYLASRKPILALVPPDSDAAELVRRADVGVVAGSTEGIRQALTEFYGLWGQGKRTWGKDETVGEFDIRGITEKMAEVLDGVTG